MFKHLIVEFLRNEDGFLGLGLSVLGGVIGAFGKKKEGAAQAEAAKLNAEQIRKRAEIDTTLRTRAGTRELGSINTAAGGSGLAGGGSAADILRESARNTAFDVLSIKTESDLARRAKLAEAKGAKTAGKIGFAGGLLGAASTLLGG